MKKIHSLLLVVASAWLFVFAGDPSKSKIARPNIIFIMADDMGYSDLGCYGSEIHTPNLDKLASQGIKLRNFYNNARCCPTRASLLTGQYPHQVGMGLMVTADKSTFQPGSYQGFLNDSFPTIAEQLKKSGYHTYMAGKWHVGERPQHWPLKRGFDRYFGLISGASSYYEILPQERAKRHFAEDDHEYELPKEGYYATDAFTDHAITYVNDHKKASASDPFFLYLAYTAPHYPLHAPEEDVKKYEALYLKGWQRIRAERYAKQRSIGLIDQRYALFEDPETPQWDTVSDKKTWARKMAVYAAMVDRMDQNVGRLIDALKKNGQYENTFIVFISDNGGSAETVNMKLLNNPSTKVGERGSYYAYGQPWANVSNTPFRMYKHFLHEGGMNTSCIMQWPAGIKPVKGFSEGFGNVMDLMPTALDIAGVKNSQTAGKSLKFIWNKSISEERTYCWEHEGNQAIRKGDWKLVKEFDEKEWQLYDLKKDPTEQHDLSLNYPERVTSMKASYKIWAEHVGVKPYAKPPGKSE